MLRRRLVPLTAVLALALSTISAGIATGTKAQLSNPEFGWTLISGGSQSNMGKVNPYMINDLRHRYGRRFLCIREGDEVWVITDEALVRSGEETASIITEYQPAIADMAQAEARLSLSEQTHEDEKAELRERRREIQKAIDTSGRRGHSTEELEQELFQVNTQYKAIQGVEESARLTAADKKRLIRQRDKASIRVRVGYDRINGGMRELLSVAKERGRAELVKPF
jgi:hypothetical protein